MKHFKYIAVVLLYMGILISHPVKAADKPYPRKVLVVMSYHDEYEWQKQLREGIDAILRPVCDIRYFSLDTKRTPSGGSQKAKEAYSLFLKIRPGGVIAADDNAQSLFIVPYLKDKSTVPVIFCGVNADPEQYGYPTATITGVLERQHLRDSIVLVQQMVPAIKKLGVICANNDSNRGMIRAIEKEAATYPIESFQVRSATTLEEGLSFVEELRGITDALHIMGIEGLTDSSGRSLSTRDIIPKIVGAYGKPTIGVVQYEVEAGAMCAVIHRGQEQGETAATMMLKALGGKSMSELPMERNRRGKAVINLTELNKLGIKPNSVIVQDAILVETR